MKTDLDGELDISIFYSHLNLSNLEDLDGALFKLGEIKITDEAKIASTNKDFSITLLLAYHILGQWQDMPKKYQISNTKALEIGERIVSSFIIDNITMLYIITEADRLSTTVILEDILDQMIKLEGDCNSELNMKLTELFNIARGSYKINILNDAFEETFENIRNLLNEIYLKNQNCCLFCGAIAGKDHKKTNCTHDHHYITTEYEGNVSIGYHVLHCSNCCYKETYFTQT